MSLNQALTRPVPLRTSAVWNEYRDITPLRVGYGEITLNPTQYDNTGRFFFLLDHGVSILSVERNADDYQTYDLHNQADSAGETISLLEIGEPLTDDETLTVKLQGRTDPDSGELITNPAWVLQDLLVNVSGYQIETSRFLAFAEECAQNHITIAGLIDNHQPTLRSTIAEIMQSIGAIWMINSPNMARLFPEPASDPDEIIYAYFENQPTALGVLDSADYRSDYDEAAIITELQIDYDYDWADQEYRQAVVLRADAATFETYGRRVDQIDARWLTSSSAADAMGERVLTWRARPHWQVSFEAIAGGVIPVDQIPDGGKINLTNITRCPIDGTHIVLSKHVDHDSKRTQFTIEGAVGLEPSVEFISRSSRLGAQAAEFFFERQADTAIIRTNPGATVSLNGRAVVADVNGRAFFPDTPPGTYELRITLTGYEEIHMPAVEIP